MKEGSECLPVCMPVCIPGYTCVCVTWCVCVRVRARQLLIQQLVGVHANKTDNFFVCGIPEDNAADERKGDKSSAPENLFIQLKGNTSSFRSSAPHYEALFLLPNALKRVLTIGTGTLTCADADIPHASVNSSPAEARQGAPGRQVYKGCVVSLQRGIQTVLL